MDKTKEIDKNFFKATSDWFKHLFNLSDEDKAHERDTKEEIKKGIVFRGANLWILIFAILVCSVGLNVNSTAVIIGAMLISPIMGPIMGIGLGMGINDFQLIVKASKNLGIALLMSVVASALYFWLSPLNEAQSEILSRTSPNFWDVLIAFFGGTAGIVASSRKEKSNAVPGVAIATALMPPLCTAGYGLATLQWNFFFGALYLFCINCVFISLSTYIIVRILKFRKKQFEVAAREKRVRRYVGIIAILTIIPSVFTGFNLVRKSVFQQNATTFIKNEINSSTCKVIAKNLVYDRHGSSIEVTLYGEELEEAKIADVQKSLPSYGLEGVKVIYNQGAQNGVDEDDIKDLKSGIIEDLYRNNAEQLKSKDKEIATLKSEIELLQKEKTNIQNLTSEAKAINKDLEEFSLSATEVASADSLKVESVIMAYAKFKRVQRKSEISKLEEWLKARTKSDKIKLVID